ncbi:MAG: RNA polymerase sigma factor, partial [Terriglobales bacterium]
MGAELTAVLDVAAVRILDVDTELMLRFQAGEAACFDELVARYRKPLLAFLYRMVRDLGASEDLLQDAFLRVYNHRVRYQPSAHFRTWVYQIAHHLALNHIRDHRRERMGDSLDQPVSACDDAPARELADSRPTVEQALLQQSIADHRRDRIRAAIAALPERQRAAVLLHKYQGLNYLGIGGILGLSESATKSLLFRAYE